MKHTLENVVGKLSRTLYLNQGPKRGLLPYKILMRGGFIYNLKSVGGLNFWDRI